MVFAHIWALDFEFRAPPGESPEPVCMCAADALTGREIRLWGDEMKLCPFRTDQRSLFVAYYASAEISCFLALGWPVPVRILDLFTEFRALTNGRHPVSGNSLLGSMTWFGLEHMAPAEKAFMRDRILQGPPWSRQDRKAILDYCMEDVNALLALLPVMESAVAMSPARWGQALFRGRYMAAVAAMERVGVPIDTRLLADLRAHWHSIQRALIDEIDVAFGVYEDGHFREKLFLGLVERKGYAWPLLPTGKLALDALSFRTMAGIYPEIEPLRRHAKIRDRVKACVLGINYGMGAQTLASRLGSSEAEARLLLSLHDETYPKFAKWREDHLNQSLLGIAPMTLFGWPLEPDDDTRPTTLRNFPVQAGGAEMLRLACCLGIERGIRICCPIHDAVLVEAGPDERIEDVVADMRACMAEASRVVLGGFEINTDVKVFRAPHRFTDARGKDLFLRILRWLKRAKTPTTKDRYTPLPKIPTY